MNTSPISSALSVLPASVQNGKQDAVAASDPGSFSQVLSDRSNASSNANNATQSTKNDGANTSDQAKNGASGATATNTAKATDDTKAAQTPDSKKDEANQANAQPAAPSADLLAYVAALANAHSTALAQIPAPAPTPAPVTPALAPTPVVIAATGVTGATTETVATAKNRNIDTGIDTTALDTTNPVAPGDKDAVGKKSDFVSALDNATATAGDSSKAPTATPLKANAEPAATALAVDVAATTKADDPAAVSNPQIASLVASTMAQHVNATQDPQSNQLTQQVGSPAWDQALGQKVVWMVQGAQQSATLTLHPPELGPLQVTLNVSNSQATASFTAAQPEVRHALEAAMPRLREMLSEAGIQLGQSNVSAGSPNQQGAFSGQRQNSSGQSSRADSNAVDPAIHVSHVPVSASGTGIVDTFA